MNKIRTTIARAPGGTDFHRHWCCNETAAMSLMASYPILIYRAGKFGDKCEHYFYSFTYLSVDEISIPRAFTGDSNSQCDHVLVTI